MTAHAFLSYQLEVTIPGTNYGTYMYDRKAINEDYRMYLKSKEKLVGIINYWMIN